jgi:preprotein translocase subunit SecD
MTALPGAADEDVPRYGLCAEAIAEAKVAERVPKEDGFTITAHLSDHRRGEFEDFTRRHVGSAVEVVFDGATLERTVLSAVIASGALQLGTWRSREAAQRMIELIKNGKLEVPCGPISEKPETP